MTQFEVITIKIVSGWVDLLSGKKMLIHRHFVFAGWFAKEPGVLHKVGYLLLQLSYTNNYQPRHFIMADDCFEMVKIQSGRLTQVVVRSVERLFGSMSSMSIGYYVNFTK